jgi:hypothetical protein
LKLLKLTEDNQQLLEKGTISKKQALAMSELSPNGQTEFLQLVKKGLVNTNKSCEAAAERIASREAQIDALEGEAAPRLSSAKSSAKIFDDALDDVAGILSKLMTKEGQFEAPDDVNINEAQNCIAKIKALSGMLGQIDREITRAASVSAAA